MTSYNVRPCLPTAMPVRRDLLAVRSLYESAQSRKVVRQTLHFKPWCYGALAQFVVLNPPLSVPPPKSWLGWAGTGSFYFCCRLWRVGVVCV